MEAEAEPLALVLELELDRVLWPLMLEPLLALVLELGVLDLLGVSAMLEDVLE